jgi:hypothetical protein
MRDVRATLATLWVLKLYSYIVIDVRALVKTGSKCNVILQIVCCMRYSYILNIMLDGDY